MSEPTDDQVAALAEWLMSLTREGVEPGTTSDIHIESDTTEEETP